jgi:Leucine-rich repeat (LRR) protein
MEEESPVIQAVRQKVQQWIDASDYTKILDLQGMNITELPADIFARCSQLGFIYLQCNRLTELPAATRKIQILSMLGSARTFFES